MDYQKHTPRPGGKPATYPRSCAVITMEVIGVKRAGRTSLTSLSPFRLKSGSSPGQGLINAVCTQKHQVVEQPSLSPKKILPCESWETVPGARGSCMLRLGCPTRMPDRIPSQYQVAKTCYRTRAPRRPKCASVCTNMR